MAVRKIRGRECLRHQVITNSEEVNRLPCFKEIDRETRGRFCCLASDKDLFFSLHKATIHVKGYKAEDGHWYISATLSDTYDFTEILFLEYGMSKQKIIGALANDGAFISQLTDAITPYEVEVNFYTRR